LKSSPRVEIKTALLGAKQLNQVGEVGLVQRHGEPSAPWPHPSSSSDNDGMQEIGANAAFPVAQFDLACGVAWPIRFAGLLLQAGVASDPGASSAPESVADCHSGLRRQARPGKALDACCRANSAQNAMRHNVAGT
jgi:hypothetical protein